MLIDENGRVKGMLEIAMEEVEKIRDEMRDSLIEEETEEVVEDE
jgi:hypothetical protein